MDPVVVVGNGIAAVSAVEAFRRVDRQTPIVLISEEPYYAYYRLRLTQKFGSLDVDKLLLHPPEWYGERGVEVILGRPAISIDIDNRRVILEDGEVTYSKLLLAQGSRPFVPPVPGSDLPGVFSIRTLDDVKRLTAYIRDKSQGTIIGGGVLGLEVAWGLAQAGQRISVVEGSPYILSRQLDKTASDLLTSLGEKAGIEFVVSERLTGIQGNGEALAILLENYGEKATDYLVFSTGVRPNTRIVQNTPIKTDKGIQVNEFMQTSVEDIYSAGDVAEFNGQVYGLWPVAKAQGECAGLNMAGVETAYTEMPPSNYIRVFGIEIYSVGDLCKDGSAQLILKDYNPEESIYKAMFFKENRPVGAILLGDTKGAPKISRAIKAGQEFPGDLFPPKDLVSFLEQIDMPLSLR